MRVLFGLNHELLTYGLIQLLKDIQPIEYMVTVGTTEGLMEVIRKYDFDLIIMDNALFDAGGRRNVLSMLSDLPDSTINVFMYNDTASKNSVQELDHHKNVLGVFHERASLKELMEFFQQVLNGEPVLSHIVMEKTDVFPTEMDNDILSKREEEVLYMKVRGYTVKDTAELMSISTKTVENHRRNIRKKLQIQKSTEWVEWGKKLGMI